MTSRAPVTNWEAVTGHGSTGTISSTCASLCPLQAGSGEWGARRSGGLVGEFGRREEGVRTDSLKSHHSDMGEGTH